MPFLAPSPFSGTPQTPGSSISDDRFAGTSSLIPGQLLGESRRGSVPVSSLLIDTPPDSKATLTRYPVREPLSTFYGYDRGYQDLDIPDNDDMSAILGSPAIAQSTFDGALPAQTETIAFEPDGYYGKPVAIKIPNPLLPLPAQLLENSMNLLYFHHFLNHTARILVPHDCTMNPYRTVLPNSKKLSFDY
jgi:hypothetical protein